MAPSVEGAGVALNVVEHGSGAPVLLIHGLAADAEAMAPVAQALAGEARVIAYDRRGYGSSGAPEPYRGTTVEEQAQDAAALLGALDAGAGGGVRRRLRRARRARPGQAPSRARAGRRALATRRCSCSCPRRPSGSAAQHAELEAAVREGGPRGRRRGVAGRPRRRPRRSSAPAPRTGPSSPTTRAWRAGRSPAASCASLDVPAVVLTGPSSPPHVVAAADALAGLMPAARRADDGDLVAAARTLLASP